MEGDDRLAHAVPARLSGSAYSAAMGRKFGLTVGVAFVVLSAIARWRGHPTSFLVFGVVGGLLVVAALLAPTALGPVDRAWMTLAGIISKVTTPIFMGVVYFVVVTPIGWVRRGLGGNALVHKAASHGFWVDRSASSRSSLTRQF